ncbi:MAG: sulfotransferase [Chthonomonadales bacterium]|nr:sulfotransferase [Chthonomonadales bacterium]
MRAYLKRTAAYEALRFLYRQAVPDPFYPPPLLQRLALAPVSAVEKRLYASGRLTARGLSMPCYLGLGAMHSGTAWLFEHLDRHPEVYIPPTKELHYFSWNFQRSVRHYARRLAPGADRIRGEITTEYLALPEARIAWVRLLAPDSRLVVLLRNPVDRAWTHARQSLMFRPGRRFADVRPAEFVRHFRSRASREGAEYLRGIDTWLRVFSADRLYIGFFDDIARRPEPMLREILRHIGASEDLAVLGPVSGARDPGARADLEPDPQDRGRWSDHFAAPIPAGYRCLLEEMYADPIEALYARFGDAVAAWRVRRPSV